MSEPRRHSYITDCYVDRREGSEEELFGDNGTVYVNLRGYAIIPMERFERLTELAEEYAGILAMAMIAKAAP